MSAAHERLVARASRGDVEAFAKLVREHSDLVHRVARRMLGIEDAQDASQEVWTRVWINIKGFRGESTFPTWLHTITVNTCLSFRKREWRREKHAVRDDTTHLAGLSEPPGGEADPEAAALNAECREEIQAALEHVRPEHRAAMVLRHMEGLSYAEIAAILKVPDGTAKGWASRGCAAMLVVLTRGAQPGSMRRGDAA